MIRRDMLEVLQIERAAFDYPWGVEDFVRSLHRRNCIGQVAEVEEQVVGFMLYELMRTRIILLNMAVRRDQQRRGVGGQLIEALKKKLSKERRSAIVLEVGERNLAGQLFFCQQGFVCDKILREPWPAEYGDQDAYRFVFRVCGGK